jgi:hypothetical protein
MLKDYVPLTERPDKKMSCCNHPLSLHQSPSPPPPPQVKALKGPGTSKTQRTTSNKKNKFTTPILTNFYEVYELYT